MFRVTSLTKRNKNTFLSQHTTEDIGVFRTDARFGESPFPQFEGGFILFYPNCAKKYRFVFEVHCASFHFHRMTQTAEPNSWADYVKTVDRDRKQLPWDPNSASPVERVSLYHVSTNSTVMFTVLKVFNL